MNALKSKCVVIRWKKEQTFVIINSLQKIGLKNDKTNRN